MNRQPWKISALCYPSGGCTSLPFQPQFLRNWEPIPSQRSQILSIEEAIRTTTDFVTDPCCHQSHYLQGWRMPAPSSAQDCPNCTWIINHVVKNKVMLPDFSPSHTSRNIAVIFNAYFKRGVFLLASIISLSLPVSQLAPVTVSLRGANPRHGLQKSMGYRNTPHAVCNHGLWSGESCKKQHTTGMFFPFRTKGYCSKTTVFHRGIMGWECQALPHILPLYTLASFPPPPPLPPWYLWFCGQSVQRADPTNSYPPSETRTLFFKADLPTAFAFLWSTYHEYELWKHGHLRSYPRRNYLWHWRRHFSC